MLKSLVNPFPFEDEHTNIEDLRNQLTVRLALLTIAVGSIGAWMTLPLEPIPFRICALSLAATGTGIAVFRLVPRRPRLARLLLIWGLAAIALIANWHFATPWLPFLSILLIFAAALLAPGNELLSSVLIAAMVFWLRPIRDEVYPSAALAATLVVTSVMAWLVARTFYTAIDWAWHTQQRADQLLHEARNNRAELSRILQSSELANALLRRTEQELIEARKQAEVAQRAKEQFAANVSHELRTPLSLILGFSEIMYLSPEVYGDMVWPVRLRRDISHIYQSSRYLLEMIDDILVLSHFEMAGFTVNKEPTDLSELIQSTTAMIQELFLGSPIVLEVGPTKEIPLLSLDRTRIRQVLLNLLNNAYRFTAEGSVRVEASVDGCEVIVRVHDTGQGIPADKLPYIFDEFYQVDLSLQRAHQGAGLGLAICKRFLEMHDGRIWVESEIGKGSTFFFSLPLPDEYVPLSRQQLSAPVEGKTHQERPTILVVEPDLSVVRLVARHIGEYAVIQVEHPNQLHAAVTQYHPRAIVHNSWGHRPVSMPTTLPVPIIQCALPSITLLAEELQVAACLAKPLSAQQLLHQLEAFTSIDNILVVDDDRGFCQLVTRILESTGRLRHIRHAYDGEEALVSMLEQPPHLLLLDLLMPGMDGLAVIERMRQTPLLHDIPIILLTATSQRAHPRHRGQGQVVIQRAGGLHTREVLQLLAQMVEIVQPRYDEHTMPVIETKTARVSH